MAEGTINCFGRIKILGLIIGCESTESFGYGSFLEGFDFPRGWASYKLKFDILFDMLDHCSIGWGPRGWIGSESIKKGFALLPEILIEI